jgi:endonuclease/exonuclease/phosphatase (EEP) superfamily protein YafD
MTTGRILFWNTQHLADSSTDRKEQRILGTVQANAAQVNILCEMMQSYVKFNVYLATYNAQTPHTLGYSAVDLAAANNIGVTSYDVEVSDDFARQNKGGHNVRHFFNRKPIEILHNLHGWPRLFALHANASKGLSCTTITALDFESNIAAPWILVGDFNTEPEQAETNLNYYGSDAVVSPPSFPTHTSSSGKKRSLDYAIHSDDFNSVVVRTLRRSVSDHDPIIIDWDHP